MSTNYITIQNIVGQPTTKVKQTLKFPTGNFVWRVKYNLALNSNTVNNRTCYVTSESGQPLKSNIRYNPNDYLIEIEPLAPYARMETYTLHITTGVVSQSGQRLKKNISLQFKM